MSEAIPSDANHVHLDRAETEFLAEFPAGEHSLQRLLGGRCRAPGAAAILRDDSDHCAMIWFAFGAMSLAKSIMLPLSVS